MEKILFALTLFGSFLGLLGKDYESSLAQANIYLQRPLRIGKSGEMRMDEVKQLENKKDIKVVIHGFLANRGHPSIVPVRNAYLSQGTDNVFMADWERAAAHDYSTSRRLVAKVAVRFAQIISQFIKTNEIEPSEMHLIGHSLGAHVVGGIGRYFNGSLGRITGLDPALPLFVPQSPDSLHPNDGKFVDVIHTDYPVFGDPTPRGHADFFPNYGRTPQPGCSDADLRTLTSCSHYRAVLLYAESIGMSRSFPAIPCSFSDILFNNIPRCRRAATLNVTVMMGEYLETSAKGEYFLWTNAVPPFGLGDNSEVYRNN